MIATGERQGATATAAKRFSTRRMERQTLEQALNTKMGAIQSRAFDTIRALASNAIRDAMSAEAPMNAAAMVENLRARLKIPA